MRAGPGFQQARRAQALHDLSALGSLRPGVTFRDQFAELIATVFEKDVVLVDALLPELRAAGGKVAVFFKSRVPLINFRVNNRTHRKLAVRGTAVSSIQNGC